MTDIKKKPSRPDMIVVIRILEILWSREGEVTKTELQNASRLNYDIFMKYLNILEDRGLIDIINKDEWHKTISLTDKGGEAYKGMINWLKVFVDEI